MQLVFAKFQSKGIVV